MFALSGTGSAGGSETPPWIATSPEVMRRSSRGAIAPCSRVMSFHVNAPPPAHSPAAANARVAVHVIPVRAARRRDPDVVEDRQLRAGLRFVEQHRGEIALALLLLDLEFERGLSGLERVDVVAIAHRCLDARSRVAVSGIVCCCPHTSSVAWVWFSM